jgi:prepilin-type N-terminal cleavage/methylation domain-containing protein
MVNDKTVIVINNRARCKRFTLLEILVAMTIISICFVVMLNALSLNITNTAIAEGYTTACLLAKEKMVEILQRDKFEEGTEHGDFGDDYLDFEWEEDIKLLEYYDDNKDASFDDSEDDEKVVDDDQAKDKKYLFQVKLKIVFKKGNQVRSLKFETVVYESEKVDI